MRLYRVLAFVLAASVFYLVWHVATWAADTANQVGTALK